MAGEFFCSEEDAQMFLRDLDDRLLIFSLGNLLMHGSNGCQRIAPGIVVLKEKISKDRKEGHGNA